MRIPGMHRIGLKLVSVILAALLWLIVAGEQIVERALRIPLEFVNLSSQLELVGDAPYSVDVRVRGSSGALGRIAAGELIAVLDLRAARPGLRLFHVTNADVRAPFGIEVVQVSPSNVSMRFDLSGTRSVPVSPRVEGEPGAGLVVDTITSVPESVQIIGAASVVNDVRDAITEPISVDGATEPVVEQVTIGVSDPAVRLRTPQTARVTITFRSR
jgi:YbbR domain-containing protein